MIGLSMFDQNFGGSSILLVKERESQIEGYFGAMVEP